MPTDADLFEAALLDVFWCRVVDRPDLRLKLVRVMADLVVPRPSDWDSAAIRAMGREGLNPDAACFICLRLGLKLSLHHLIQVQNGGSNSVRNHVMLCQRCHSRVHPWLPERTPGSEREFVLLRDVVASMGKR